MTFKSMEGAMYMICKLDVGQWGNTVLSVLEICERPDQANLWCTEHQDGHQYYILRAVAFPVDPTKMQHVG